VHARCSGIDAEFARRAIDAVLAYRTGKEPAMSKEKPSKQLEKDRLYDAFAALVDTTPPAERERMLARLAIALAEQLGDYGRTLRAIDAVKS
jgi:hypothetical protein